MDKEKQRREKKMEAPQEELLKCKHCSRTFKSQRALDDHTTGEHVFVCGDCLKIFLSKILRNQHVVDHHDLTPQQQQLVEMYQRRRTREDKDRRVREEWDITWATYVASKQQKEIDDKARKTKEEADIAEGDDKDADEDYHPSEDAGDTSSTDPTFKPSKKDLKRADKEGDK